MDHIKLDSQTAALLLSRKERVELRDPDGNVLGYFEPSARAVKYSDIEIPFTAEELKQASRQTTGRPLEDILRDLRARE